MKLITHLTSSSSFSSFSLSFSSSFTSSSLSSYSSSSRSSSFSFSFSPLPSLLTTSGLQYGRRHVVPVYRKYNSRSDSQNHMPIFLLSVVGKVFERIMAVDICETSVTPGSSQVLGSSCWLWDALWLVETSTSVTSLRHYWHVPELVVCHKTQV